jgi:hypothetical protein
VALGLALGLSSPLWLRNLVWYGDPLYPTLRSVFHARHWVRSATTQVTSLYTPHMWVPERSWKGAWETLRALYEYAFVPHNWETFHRDLPVFGFLFTLTVPLLLLFHRARRLLIAYASCHVGILFWYWTAHQDRYLQALVPIMASGVAAVLCAVWQMGVLPRLAASTLLVLQVAWGGDTPFFPTHAMLAGGSSLKNAIDLLASGFNGERERRLDVFSANQGVARALPKDATLLVHEMPDHLGFEARTVSDTFQTQIDYATAPSPAGVYDLLQRFGVTHIVVRAGASRGQDSVGGDIAFHYFFTNAAQEHQRHAGLVLAAMPAEKPASPAFHDRALYIGCSDRYDHGLYAIRALNVPVDWNTPRTRRRTPAPLQPIEPGDDLAPLLAEADAVVHGPKCFKAPISLPAHGFVKVASRNEDAIWVRKAEP